MFSEAEARQESDLFRELLRGLPGVAYRCRNEPDWPVTYISEGIREFTGYDPDEFLSGRIALADLIHPDDRRAVWKDVQTALAVRGPYRLTYRVFTKDGRERIAWEQGRGVYGPGGELLHLEGFVTDVSDRHELEEQLFRSQKMEAVGKLAGGIAHDFNNLLTVIQGYSDVVLSALPSDSGLRTKVGEIRRAANRAADLTRQLLAFSRRQILQFRVMNLNDVVMETIGLLEPLLGGGIRIDADLEPDLRPIHADPAQIVQVIVNLGVNARDAMKAGGVLRIATRNFDATVEKSRAIVRPRVVLDVSDTGAGIPVEIQDRIFEPFFTTKEVGQGAGLGLSTVYGIVTQCGGTIRVESEADRGAKFLVSFPAHLEVAAPAAAPAPDGGGNRNAILLVEDDQGVRELVEAVLAEAGYPLLVAEDGPKAIDLFRRSGDAVHLLLTDLSMPGMDGREVARQLREIRPELPVLFVTGYAEGLNHKDLGGTLLPKPFSPEDVLRAVARMFRSSPSGS